MNDLRSMLMSEMSRRNTDFIKDIVLADKDMFDELFKLTILNEEPVSRRAMWVADVASEEENDILLPYISELIAALPVFNHDALKRHTLRMLCRYHLSLDIFMPILDLCFIFIKTGNESVAVRYQAMHLLYIMSKIEPALKYELASTIELQMKDGSSGLQNQAYKMLKQLQKEIQLIENNQNRI